MAARRIQAYLNEKRYDHFHELFHALTEVVLSKVNSVYGYCQILKIISAQSPEIFPDTAAFAHLAQLTALARQFEIDMRQFCWPQPPEDLPRQTTAFSMKRWVPYDEAAWDAMFTQMIAILQPSIQPVRAYCKTVDSYLTGASPETEKASQMLMRIDNYLDALSRICNPEEVESFLFGK